MSQAGRALFYAFETGALASGLIELLRTPEIFRVVENVWEWEPQYGRLAEAQVRWERLTPVLIRWIPQPHVLHPYPDARFNATHPS